MKNFKNFVSFFLIVSILSMNAGVFVSPVFAFEKENVNFEQNGNNFLPKIIKEGSYIKKEFRERMVTDRQIETELNKNEIKSLEKFKGVESIEKDNKNYVEGEVLVKFKEQKINLEQYSGRVKAKQFATNKNLDKKEDIRKSNISVLKIKGNESVEDMIGKLRNDSNVEYVEPNYIRQWTSTIPNDNDFSKLWGLHNTTEDVDIDMPEAWDTFTGSNTVVVAVLDSGIEYNHPDLKNNMWDGNTNHGWDFFNNDNDPLDDNGHGTHVAGTIGAEGNNNIGVAGVNWDVKLMALKVGDYAGNVGDIVEAIDFVINNDVKIINASFGASIYSQAEFDAIDRFKQSGGIFISAAGNDTNNNDVEIHFYPSDYDLNNIISVAATNEDDGLADFSNYGSTSVDVGAPGVNIYSTMAGLDIFSENFESVIEGYNVGQFTPGGITTNWWGVGNDGCSKVIYADYFVKKYAPAYPYESNAHTWLTSNSINLSSGDIESATLGFTIWCDTPIIATFDDYIHTSYYSNGGWHYSIKYDELQIYSDGGSSYTDNGYTGYYKTYTENISDYLTDDFRFSFDWITDSSVDYNLGCTIDNIKITKYTDGSDEQYGYKNGTSMAAPHVAGLAGLIWGYKPNLTYAEVKDVILSTGDDLPSLAGKTVTGKRINAYNALNSIQDTTAPILTEITPVISPTNDNTPDYTFNSSEAGTINYEGLCASLTTEAISGNNIITFNTLDDGLYNGCVITVTDADSNESDPLTISEFTIDTTPPEIVLNGDEIMNLIVGDNYDELGATATDDMEGELTALIVVDGDTVDTSTVGTYIVTYNVSDSAGNPAEEVIRTVNVSEEELDEIPPVITLLGDDPITIEVGAEYSDAGATAEDNIDGDISESIVTDGDVVDTSTLGIYVITYNVSDSAGNPATEITRTVNVVDTTIPVITLLGDDPVTIEVGTTYNDAGATANDNYDGNITADIIIINPVDSNTIGTYEVTYNVIDSSENAAIEIARSVNVVDTTPPVINLLGENPVTIPVNTAYEDAGATADDNYDGDITNDIVTVNSVDINTIGAYQVVYNVSDNAGNNADEIIRIVNVVDISTPVITLLGSNPTNVDLDTEYNDAGATALDDVDGDITDNIVAVNNVNINIPGSYSVTYNVTDSSGNPAPEVVRIVNVIDSIAPVITLIGVNPANVEVGSQYSDAGATASDNYDGDITNSIVIVNNVDINTTGTYSITYNVSDNAENPAIEVTRIVNVVDTTPPILSECMLVNTPTMDRSPDWAFDNSELGIISYSGSCSSETIEALQGENTITFNEMEDGVYNDCSIIVTDGAGNPSEPLTISEFTIDNVIPVITLLGSNPINLYVGDAYEEAGATATDNVGIINEIIIDSSAVDTSEIGTYEVAYNVSDIAGNQAEEVIRTVIVLEEPILTYANVIKLSDSKGHTELQSEYNNGNHTWPSPYPVLEVGENITITVEVSNSVADPVLYQFNGVGFSNVWQEENEVTVNIDNDIFNVETIHLRVFIKNSDEQYRAPYYDDMIQVFYKKEMSVSDTIIPEIILVGDNPVNLYVNDIYEDAGATAEDNIDGDITDSIVTTGLPIDTITAGNYTITYNVSDSAGNPADEVTRTVIVSEIPDTTIPVITLLGDNPVNLYVGDFYTDAGATATDDVDGDITADIIVVNPVDISVADTYIITYNVSDVAGNSADEATRTVVVSPTPAPSGGGGGGGGGTDATAPSISKIEVTFTSTEAIITWKTNESSISWIVYGINADYGLEKKTTVYTTSHSIKLSDLSPGAIYHYQIKSKDRSGNKGEYTDKSFVAGGANVADINSDSKVDKYDFSMMMASWGKTGSNSSDLNNDNKVDKYDFALLMSNWGAK